MGRRQAFALVAGRCSAADAEILVEIREKKHFRKIEATWEDFCVKRLGVSRSYVDRVIRQSRELGSNFAKLSSFTRIKPAEYRQIASAVTDVGLSYGGEVIALGPENAPKRRPWKHSAAIRTRKPTPPIPRNRPLQRPRGPSTPRSRNSSGCNPWSWISKYGRSC